MNDNAAVKQNAQAAKTVLIMAGGTGGHVFPGLDLASELRQRGYDIHWLGTEAGLESRLVPKANIPLHYIPVRGIRGKRLTNILAAPINILMSVWLALKIIKKINPQVVVGLGGFVAGPGGVAARLLGLPLVIHEQNAVIGTTNKLLAKIANRVLCAFPISISKAICIGNPVRAEIESLAAPKLRINQRSGALNILVVGGSRGAQAINELVPRACALAIKNKAAADGDAVQVNIWHQAGDKKDAATVDEYQQAGVQARVDPFIENMSEALDWADFVICRSGALTVSELAAAGLGALFIPYPYAIDDHQTANAEYLVSAGAAIVKQQSDLDETTLAEAFESLIFDRNKVCKMACLARELARPKAAIHFADYCEEFVNA
ncbi:MAG: undecaprenyldiphospho-muramoylpentapeptide beta-N-acetylglucosaminyltransferase [Alteromonadaceae bacterium]|nr:MAG: undecaprenyldiphospho-muramoylpentapeptide beta-N-acetylglucosaminyltransferase [Alteromonadaceae bacterium]